MDQLEPITGSVCSVANMHLVLLINCIHFAQSYVYPREGGKMFGTRILIVKLTARHYTSGLNSLSECLDHHYRPKCQLNSYLSSADAALLQDSASSYIR